MFKKVVAVICICSAMLACFFIKPFAEEEKKQFETVVNNNDVLFSGRFTQTEPQNGKYNLQRLNTNGFMLLVENENYAIYYNTGNTQIRVLDKMSGYIWGAADEFAEENLNAQWYEMASGLITIQYLDSESMSYQISSSSVDVLSKYDIKENTAVFDIDAEKLGISFSVNLELYEDGVQLSLAKDSLKEKGEYLLQSLYFAPFFGSTHEDEIDGYMFVPDGCGALIRYAKSSDYLSPFEGKVYGLDMSVDQLERANDLMAKRTNDYLTENAQVTVPVFGVTHGADKNAFLAVINGGAEYATVYASPAGYVTDYNWVTSRFDFRTVYTQRVKKDGSGITVNQRKANSMIPSIRYYFLRGDDADYSGMAVKYRNLLKEDKILKSSEKVDSNIPLRIEALAADIKKGNFIKKYIPFTTVEQALGIYKDLIGDGIFNLTFVYSGWTKGGINGGKYSNISLDKKLGSRTELSKLADKISSDSNLLYLGYNPITANEDQINYTTQATMSRSRKNAYFLRDNPNILYKLSYVLKPDLVVESIKNYADEYSGYNFAVDQIGIRAYGDYARTKTTHRNKAIKNFDKAIDSIETNVALYTPNQYFWDSVSDYFNMYLENSQYLFETDSVPFLPIVLKGSIDYYSPYINQGYYTQHSILKMIEYGTYPSFLVISENNESLIGTPSEDFFSLNFEDWRSTIRGTYSQMNSILTETEGAFIEKHQAVSDGVICVTYSNGVKILINYSQQEYTHINGQTVSAIGCAVIREG